MAKIETDQNTPTSRRDQTREKLLAASLDVFGRYGFDGASTRQLADAAGVNLQAIPYYFSGKEGLYLATADYLTEMISGHVGDMRQRVGARMAALDATGERMTPDEARAYLTEIAQTMIALFVSEKSESWARFIIREQMEPTEAFTRVYQGIMRPMIEIARRLIGTILGEDPASEHVRLRAFSFIGGIMVFRMAHAAVLAQMEWDSAGPNEVATLRKLAVELVAVLQPVKGGAA
ncbi:CerR family C-terminal domain-containing protein [Pararhizobium sp. BT-229]|uniref:CerR family C-terminal domain-containing protein n=1 Tax=Pararhizobium sp. BT-229 TaxID=2986923 RepID=UPI0021F6AF80|nr:CerR family C-terminal domain-containing protein [Pararhizobium sp. BT-229]MCV9962221.1 CerR family C-terminal domain-containing protein [Pararhizobium sp. BT-229]